MNEKITFGQSAAVVTLLVLNSIIWTVAVGEILLFWVIAS